MIESDDNTLPKLLFLSKLDRVSRIHTSWSVIESLSGGKCGRKVLIELGHKRVLLYPHRVHSTNKVTTKDGKESSRERILLEHSSLK